MEVDGFEDFVCVADTDTESFRRSFSFESYSDFLFEDRLLTSHVSANLSSTSQDTHRVSCPSSTSSFYPSSASDLLLASSSSTECLTSHTDFLNSYESSVLLCGEIPTLPPQSGSAQSLNNSEATASRANQDPVAYSARCLDDVPVCKANVVERVFEDFKSSSHANYFSFVQNVLCSQSCLLLSDFLKINQKLLQNSCFQRNNYWLRIAPEIASFLLYSVDYLSGNCPNSFYHRSFSYPIKLDVCGADSSPIINYKLIWVTDVVDDDVLLTWTDVWWSCRYMQYTPKTWRLNISDIIPQSKPEGEKRSRKRRGPADNQAGLKTAKNLKPFKPKNVKSSAKTNLSLPTSKELLSLNSDRFLSNSHAQSEVENNTSLFESCLDYAMDGSSYVTGECFPIATSYADLKNDVALDFFKLPECTLICDDLLDSTFADNVSEDSELHRQEQQRFSNPSVSFTYTLPNSKSSVVGPTYGASLLINNCVPDYPNVGRHLLNQSATNIDQVYIVDLVRDATARLPSGEGSRLDVFNLFKQSQFVNSKFIFENDNLVNGIVGKCLEVLQNCSEPCVDLFVDVTGRSSWRYLPTISKKLESSGKNLNRCSSTVNQLRVAESNDKVVRPSLLGVFNDHSIAPASFVEVVSGIHPGKTTFVAVSEPTRGRPSLKAAKANRRNLDWESLAGESKKQPLTRNSELCQVVARLDASEPSANFLTQWKAPVLFQSLNLPLAAAQNKKRVIPSNRAVKNKNSVAGANVSNQMISMSNKNLSDTTQNCANILSVSGMSSRIQQCSNPFIVQRFSIDSVS